MMGNTTKKVTIKQTGYLVDGLKQELVTSDWDFLVILDACKYNVFLEVYKMLFNNKGNLKKAISPASWTMEWLNKVFPEYYEDIIYVSANYFINSIREVTRRAWMSPRLHYSGREHFFKVIDVWRKSWDETLGTVHPSSVNQEFKRAYLAYPNKRFILHYLQPHYPYISLGGTGAKKPTKGMSSSGKKRKPFYKVIRDELLSQALVWNLKSILNINPDTRLEAWYRKHGKAGMKGLYRMDVELATSYVSKLIQNTKGRWLITADHSERICNLFMSNHGGRHDKEVTEVPWLEIQGGETIGTHY